MSALDELWLAMQARGAEEGARETARRWDCSYETYGAGYTLVLPIPPGATVLEVGAGFGDETLALAHRAARVLAMVPDATAARIVERRLAERGCSNVELLVAADAARLALPDGAVQAIAMEHAAVASFGVAARRLPELAREWRRVLAPGGAVLLGLENAWLRLRPLAAARAALVARRRPESLNRRVKRLAGGNDGPALTLRQVRRAFEIAGFDRASLLAPLPDERRAESIVPLDDPTALDHFLRALLRRESHGASIALAQARVLARVGLLWRVVPYWYVLLR